MLMLVLKGLHCRSLRIVVGSRTLAGAFVATILAAAPLTLQYLMEFFLMTFPFVLLLFLIY